MKSGLLGITSTRTASLGALSTGMIQCQERAHTVLQKDWTCICSVKIAELLQPSTRKIIEITSRIDTR